MATELHYFEPLAESLEAAGRALMVDPKHPAYNQLAPALREAGEQLQRAAAQVRNIGAELEAALGER